jgi:NAD(P)-dependent dehydrogenase (short-subunit alcohol dehydrogenase family)
VTGAAKGIGEAVALRLAAEGGPLVLVDVDGAGGIAKR